MSYKPKAPRELAAEFENLPDEQRAVAGALAQFAGDETQAFAVAPLAKVLLELRDSLAKIAKFGETS